MKNTTTSNKRVRFGDVTWHQLQEHQQDEYDAADALLALAASAVPLPPPVIVIFAPPSAPSPSQSKRAPKRPRDAADIDEATPKHENKRLCHSTPSSPYPVLFSRPRRPLQPISYLRRRQPPLSCS